MSIIVYVFTSILFSTFVCDAQDSSNRTCSTSSGAVVCSIDAECVDKNGSFSCECKSRTDTKGDQCRAIEVCSGGIRCHALADCVPVSGTHRCICIQGYEGNGRICTDVDECIDDSLYNCPSTLECKNTLGNYTCSAIPPAASTDDGGLTTSQIIIFSVVACLGALFAFCALFLLISFYRRRNIEFSDEDQIGELMNDRVDTILVPVQKGFSRQSFQSQRLMQKHSRSQSLVSVVPSNSIVIARSPHNRRHSQQALSMHGRHQQFVPVTTSRQRIVSSGDIRANARPHSPGNTGISGVNQSSLTQLRHNRTKDAENVGAQSLPGAQSFSSMFSTVSHFPNQQIHPPQARYPVRHRGRGFHHPPNIPGLGSLPHHHSQIQPLGPPHPLRPLVPPAPAAPEIPPLMQDHGLRPLVPPQPPNEEDGDSD